MVFSEPLLMMTGAGGVLAGLLSWKIAGLMIVRRTPAPDGVSMPGKRWIQLVVFALIGAVVSVIAYQQAGTVTIYLIWLVYLIANLALAAVDLTIRKIPNEMLVILILARTTELILSQNLELVLISLMSLVAGYLFFMLPSLIGRTIGRGDLKLAAVIGFCLTWRGLIQSVAVMGVILFFYSVLLLLTKRGNLRTRIPMGPFLSIGMIFSVLFNLMVSHRIV